MALDRRQVVEAAFDVLREHGLAALSMRRLAGALGVAPGAIYWYISSKQELLVDVADRILAPAASPSPTDARAAAVRLRTALLSVRDGAEVVSFALSFRPDGLAPLRALSGLFAELPSLDAEWAARTLTYFVLGAVAEEQNRQQLVRAGILSIDLDAASRQEAFLFGVDAILNGLPRRA